VVGEREAGGAGLQLGEHQNQRVLQGIGPAGIGAGQLGEPLGVLLAVGGLTTQVLDHPVGGIGLGRQGGLDALFCKQGSLELAEGLGAAVVVIGFQLLGELADGSGEILGLDAQLPERAGTLQGTGRAGGLGESWGERYGGGGENGHGDGDVRREREERRGDRRSGGARLRREGRRHFHHHHRHWGPGGAAAGLLDERGRARPTGEGDHQH